MRRKYKKQLRVCDILVLLAFLCMLGCRFFTISMIFEISEVTGQTVANVARTYEGNPLMVWIFGMRNITMVLVTMVIPGMVVTLYFMLRKKIPIIHLQYYSTLLFLVMLINVLNDMAYYLAR